MTAILTGRASRQMNALDRSIRERIVARIEYYLEDPNRPGIARALIGRSGYYRLRAGDWRIVFHIEMREGDDPPLMVIENVAHRREVYDR